MSALKNHWDNTPKPTVGCWLWVGAVDKDGYPLVDSGRVARLTYAAFFGPIPENLFICHHCDTPGCVRPDHWFLGTAADNKADCIRKGRAVNNIASTKGHAPRGENHGRHKLTQVQVTDIRARLAKGETHTAIAAGHGVARATVSMINTGKNWSKP
jgi:hypothetical protein